MIKWIGLAISCFALQLHAHPAQVMIIRHAEKNFVGDLNQQGLERASALAVYFENQPELQIYGLPVAIFAARPTLNTFPYDFDDNSARCLQTIAPTARLFKMPIHAGFAKFQEEELAQFIMGHEAYKGKNLVICWHSDTIPDLASAFGINPVPATYPPDEFDQTWVITFIPAPSLQIYHQHLLFGDLNITP